MLIVRYTLSVEDLREVWRHVVLSDAAHRRVRLTQALVPITMATSFVVLALSFRFEASGSPLAVAILAAALAGATLHLWKSYPDRTVARIARNWSKQAPPYAQGEITLEVDENGVASRSSQMQTTYQWSAFTSYTDLPDHIVLWLGQLNVVPVPKRALAEGELNDLLKILSGHVRAA
jgi:hypothetical protein